MDDIYDNFAQRDLPPPESRLQTDAFFGPLNYPDNFKSRDQYFREGLMLLRAVTNQTEKVRTVIASYIRYVTDPTLRLELEQFLQSLPTEAPR